MDIQSQFNKRKLLRTNQGIYDLTKCRWKAVNNLTSKKREINNPPSQGYMHASVMLKNSLCVIVGPDERYPQQTMYSYNFKYNQWKHWSDCGLPAARDTFGFTNHKNQLFMFGGSTNQKQFGDTYYFSNFTSAWQELEGFSPSARTPMLFTDINSQYILLYGGANYQTSTLLQDAYLFINKQWKPLQVINGPSGLTGAKCAVCEQKVYVFGGEIQSNGLATPNQAIFQLYIDTEIMSIQFTVVACRGNSTPSPRTAHSMIGLDSNYFILLGGTSLEQSSKNQILRDIWLFDTQERSWTSLDPVNGVIRGVSQGNLTFNGNTLILLGGSVQRLDVWNQQLTLIQFAQDQNFKSQICSNCQLRSLQRQKQQKSFPKSLVISAGFFYNLSLQYKHPFQAIAALHRFAQFMQASKFRFSVKKEMNQNEFIAAQWDGRSLNRTQFQHFICHSESNNQIFNHFVSILKLASLRLGKTLLFTSNDDKQRKVFLFSADSKVIPEFDDIYAYFSYIQNIEKNAIESHEGKMNKKLILNVLHSRMTDPQSSLSKPGNHLFIFQKNILVTSEKIYYYELINSTSDDVTIFRNLKKIQFLDQIGYSISRQPQISLNSYMSVAKFNRQLPEFYINSSIVPVEEVDYLSVLKKMEENAKIRRFQLNRPSQQIDFESYLYVADDQDVIEGNLGVLIYFEGILVNRLHGQFGDLFKQLFYMTKFKSASTTFEFMGIINIKRGLTLTYLGNDFRKDKFYYELIDCVKNAMKNASNEKMNKRARISSEEIRH